MWARFGCMAVALTACFIKPSPQTNSDAHTPDSGATDGYVSHPNIAFVTSSPVNLETDIATLDGACNNMATAAQLFGTFKAWMSGTNIDAKNRFAHGERGWVRTDGLTFAASASDLLAGTIMRPLDLDETGHEFDGRVATGSDPTGTRVMTCQTDTKVSMGSSLATQKLWTQIGANAQCTLPARIYCFEDDDAPPVPAEAGVTTGHVFASDDALHPGTGLTPQELCNVTNTSSHPLLAKMGSARNAANVSPTSSYARPDGVIVTKDGFATIIAPLNETASGHYISDMIFLGAPDFTTAPIEATNCTDWSVSDASTAFAFAGSSIEFPVDPSTACSMAARILCVN